MRRSDTDRIARGGFAALVVLVAALSLSACASVPPGGTRLSWPVGTTYTVRSGDTVSEIADDYGLPENTLVAYNGLDNRNRIFVGQVLRIPRDGYVPRARPVARPYRAAPRRDYARRTAPRHHEPKHYARRAPEQPQHVVEAQAYAAPLRFDWPLSGRVLSSFGATANGGRNDGINIAATTGEPIRAAASGSVIYAGNELKGYGNLVLIRHEDGYVTAYAHAERISVTRGTHVKKGQIIGLAGATGNVRRPQLHFEIRRGVQPVNPRPLLVASAAS